MEQIITLCLAIALFGITLFLYRSFSVNTKKFTTSRKGIEIRDITSLPTVTVCVPARNETHVLSDCLSSIISSNYPKLEVLVLDDCSQDRTSQIIRGFAHDGVRFIKGSEPEQDWLGKNNAYESLYRQAHGQYIVFISVETLLESDTIEKMIDYMLRHRIEMVSVLPRKSNGNFIGTIVSPLRFFWQMVLPLSLNTPVASQLWAVKAQTLRDINGFVSIKDEILPENKLADRFKKEKKYHFITADRSLRVTSIKGWSGEIESSIRIWSPVLKKKPLYLLLAAFGHFFIFVAPTIIILRELYAENATLASLVSVVANAVLAMIVVRYFTITTGRVWLAFLGLMLIPYIVVQEVVLMILSFYRYMRGTVEWKGRNICYPKRPIV